jgi:menaquinone-dependent protoporphyrinogen oxidase
VKVLIAYRSRYGTTAACSSELSEQIQAGARLVDLGKNIFPDVEPFEIVLIGGSIYGGKIQREVVSFCEKSRERLLARKVAAFLCCLYQGEQANAQLRASFPPWLLAHAFSSALFGGELRLRALRPIDRMLLKGLPRGQGDVSLLRHDEITRLAETVNSLLTKGGRHS